MKGLIIDNILQYELPFADGNKDIWTPNVKIQNPLAKIEIISWDSSLLIVMSEIVDIIDMLHNDYPKASDLVKYKSQL